jgi:myo-inositol-1(or 4)-monophosphatase
MKEDIIKRYDTIQNFLPELNSYLIETQTKFGLDIQKKGPVDLVTEADLYSEKLLRDLIQQEFPDDAILSEESESKDGISEYRWIIDPVDGTTNFAHGLPLFGVCIGLENVENGKIEMGIVSFPALQCTYHAVRGQGAYKNNTLLKVSKTNELINALVTTGFPYDKKNRIDSILDNFKKMLLHSRDIRRTGVASLDMCWIAEGKFDAYWEENLKPWDMAAASIIIEEAGGKLTTFDGNQFSPFIPNLLATNTILHETIMELFDPLDPNDEIEYRIK